MQTRSMTAGVPRPEPRPSKARKEGVTSSKAVMKFLSEALPDVTGNARDVAQYITEHSLATRDEKVRPDARALPCTKK